MNPPTGPRTLIIPTHPGVQYHFCRVGLPTYFLGHWDQFKYWRPQPANVTNLLPAFEDAQLEWGPDDYARLLRSPSPVGFSERFDLAWLMFNWQWKLLRSDRSLPKLYRVAKSSELDHAEWSELLARDDFSVVSFYPNTVAWLKNTFGVEVPYVPLGLDPEDYDGWTGERAAVLSVIHSYRDRGWHHGAYLEAMQGLDATHVDHLDPTKPVQSYDDIRRHMRAHRVYLHDGEQEYTITLLEALMTGMPIVSFALPGIERYVVHGHNGFVGRSAREIRAHCEALLHDRDLAETMGAASRAMALAHYSEDRWRSDWIALTRRYVTP